MAKGIHKGTEYDNINETWNQNESRRERGEDIAASGTTQSDSDLQKVIQEEAAEYDNSNKEERILGGDRATVNDDDAGNSR